VGLIKELVLLPVAPLRFTVWVSEKVAEEADREQYSTGAGVQQLEEIEEAREKGELDEEKAAELEGEVLQQQMAPTAPAAEEEEGAQGG
jgi:gas vesicle protein GvpG